jgi:hypothetical protein
MIGPMPEKNQRKLAYAPHLGFMDNDCLNHNIFGFDRNGFAGAAVAISEIMDIIEMNNEIKKRGFGVNFHIAVTTTPATQFPSKQKML